MPAASSACTYYEMQGHRDPPHPPLEGPAEARTCIVGGGLAGLATALSLVERGEPAPILLEAGRIGDGASGRNGGLVTAGFASSTDALERRLGIGHAKALIRLSRDGQALLRARIARHAIPCGLRPGVLVASWFDAPEALKEEADRQNERHGHQLEFWPRQRLRELYRSPRYFDGLLDPEGFHLDPLALCDGHARAALAQGVRIFEGTPALALERQGAGFRLATPEGEVRAARVVLCQSAYAAPALSRRLARAILPVTTCIIVTEPLDPDLAASAIRAPYAVYDDRFATGYYRLLPDRRLLWGGRITLRERPPCAFIPLLRRDLATVFPQLRGVRIDHAWSGRMGFTRSRMPLIRELSPDLWTATGFGGHGLNTTTMAGELLARALTDGDPSFRLFAPFRPAWAGGLGGRLAAQGLFHGLALRDALRAARDRRRERGRTGQRSRELPLPSSGSRDHSRTQL